MRPKTRGAAAEPDPVDPAAIEGPVADGLLIARSAASFAVANRIIVRALRENEDFDRDETRRAVKDEIANLVTEQRDLAERMVETRSKALKSRGRSRHQFDYRRGDSEPLAQREAIYGAIADRLDELQGDPAYVDEIVTAARDRAWNDIGATIMSRVHAIVVVDDDYAERRDDRLRQLVDVDLAALASR